MSYVHEKSWLKIPGKVDILSNLVQSCSLLTVSSKEQERQKGAAIQKYLPGMLLILVNVVTSFVRCFI